MSSVVCRLRPQQLPADSDGRLAFYFVCVLSSFAETCARDKASTVVLTGLPFLVVVVVVTTVQTSPSSLNNLSEKGGKLLAALLREK